MTTKPLEIYPHRPRIRMTTEHFEYLQMLGRKHNASLTECVQAVIERSMALDSYTGGED